MKRQRIEINLDGAHVYFVHPSHPQTVAFRQRGASRADSQHEMRITDRGLVMFWPPAASASEPIPPQAARIQFELPNLIRIQTPGDNRTLLLFFVPTGPRSCRLDYLITQPSPAGPKLIWLEKPPEILEQPSDVLGAHLLNGEAPEPLLEVRAPALPVQLKRALGLLAGHHETLERHQEVPCDIGQLLFRGDDGLT